MLEHPDDATVDNVDYHSPEAFFVLIVQSVLRKLAEKTNLQTHKNVIVRCFCRRYSLERNEHADVSTGWKDYGELGTKKSGETITKSGDIGHGLNSQSLWCACDL